jgi:hypothetical protein
LKLISKTKFDKLDDNKWLYIFYDNFDYFKKVL